MKKFISKLLIAFIILAQLSLPALAEQNAYTPNAEKDISLLTELGVISDTLYERFKPGKEIKRAEFAALVSGLINGGSFSGVVGSEAEFNDVSSSHQFYNEIMTVKAFGIISGDGGTDFRPDDKIRNTEALKMLVSALGYDELAKNKGGYPTGYFMIADDIDLLDNISALSEYISFDEAAVLAANAAHAPVMEYKSIGAQSSEIKADDSKTLLDVYRGIKCYSGQLRGIKSKQLSGDIIDKDEKLLIGGVLYTKANNKSYESYFGRFVDYYINSDKELVTVSERNHDNYSMTVLADDIAGFSGSTLSYYDGDKLKTVRIASDSDIIYNGRPYSPVLDSDFMIDYGQIELINCDKDAQYDVAIIESPETFVVKKANGDKNVLYDMYEKNKVFSADDIESWVFMDEMGRQMYFSELYEYDVISILRSKDNKLASLVYSNTEIEGSVNSVDTEEKSVTINEKQYPLGEAFAEGYADIELGKSGLFVLDIYGRVSAYKPYDSSYKYAYLMGIGKDSGLNGAVSAKLIDTASTVHIFEMDEKVVLNGSNVEAKDAYASLGGADFKQQLVRYYTKNGKLKGIDTVLFETNESENSLHQIFTNYNSINESQGDVKYNVYQGIFGMKVATSAGTKVFVVPSENTGDDADYRCTDMNYFVQDRNYSIRAFSTEKKSPVADILIIYSSVGVSDITEKTDYTVVERVGRAIDENGDDRYKVYGLSAGKKVSYFVYDNAIIDNLKSIIPDNPAAEPKDYTYGKSHSLVCGDIIKMHVDANGYIREIKLYYEHETDSLAYCLYTGETYVGDTPVGSYVDLGHRNMKVNVYMEKNGYLWLTQNALSTSGIELSVDDVETINASLYSVYKYKTVRGEPQVSVASYADIIDYISSESGYSKLVVCSKYNDPGMILIKE